MPNKKAKSQQYKQIAIKQTSHVFAWKLVTKSIEKWPWTRFVLPVYNRKWLVITTILASIVFLAGTLMFSLGRIASINTDSKKVVTQIVNVMHFWAPSPKATYIFDILLIVIGLFLFLGALFMLFWDFDFFHWFTIPKINKYSSWTLLIFNLLYFTILALLLVTLVAIIFNILTVVTWGHAVYQLY